MLDMSWIILDMPRTNMILFITFTVQQKRATKKKHKQHVSLLVFYDQFFFNIWIALCSERNTGERSFDSALFNNSILKSIDN